MTYYDIIYCPVCGSEEVKVKNLITQTLNFNGKYVYCPKCKETYYVETTENENANSHQSR